jgi:hypothetical protein
MSAKIYLTLLTMVMLPGITIGQMEGDQWVIGYWGPSGTDQSVMSIDFRPNNFTITKHINLKIQIIETISNICDSNGEFIVWTNGMQIMDHTGELIADTIAYDGIDGYWDYFYLQSYQMPLGFPKHDGAIILPVPGINSEYSVIYHYAEEHPTFIFAPTQYLEARIAFHQDSGFILRYKDVPIGPRIEWYTGTISAVQHANGRDWWLINFLEDSPKYLSHLLDPSGIRFDHEGEVDSFVREGLGQAVFSPLGNYFARMDAINQANGEFITLYQFDRCGGNLERIATFNTPTGTFAGVAFSPSERFLYADNNTKLWQWDLWADDIAASQVLVDSFDGFVQTGWGPMRFGPMVNAPDGKIYIVPSAGSSKYLHVIDRPDLPATECRFLQHHINLEIWNGRSAPNIPNYRLGPLDDSECDTLGLNNLPVSRWRYDEDQPGYAELIHFTDLSFFNPDSWHWDFGDGHTSDAPSPLHLFDHGLYHVCLTVSNEYATDSSCQWVEILPTGIKEERDKNIPELTVYPNPFNEFVELHSKRGTFRTVHMQLYDMHGRLILNEPTTTIPSKIYFPDYPPGIYLLSLKEESGITTNFKLLKK